MAKKNVKPARGKAVKQTARAQKPTVRRKKRGVKRPHSEDTASGRKVQPTRTDVVVQSGQMGQTSDQSSELNLSPSDIRETGFGEFIDDEWRMDEDVREDLVRPRDANVGRKKSRVPRR